MCRRRLRELGEYRCRLYGQSTHDSHRDFLCNLVIGAVLNHVDDLFANRIDGVLHHNGSWVGTEHL